MKEWTAEPYVIHDEPERRLSPWRVMLGIFLVAGISFGSFFGFRWWQQTQASEAQKPWFASYVDVTATPAYDFEQLGGTATPHVILSFIVSSQSDPCTPSWGSVYSLNEASNRLDLNRRIARLQQLKGSVAVSFGGQLNSELALKCTDPAKLLQAYQAVINYYDIDTIDLDLEGSDLADTAAMQRRAEVIAELQSSRRKAGKNLAVWLTLPVTPFGLTTDGTNAVAAMLKNKVDLAGVNVMTMDYGQSKKADQSMQQASEAALTETQRQLGILYRQAGLHLGTRTLWRKIGATPMIGQNDTTDEVFGLTDAEGLHSFAVAHGIGRMSMWSANRDIQCGENYVDVKIVSTSCSGVKQDKLAFATTLGQGFTGDFKHSATLVTTNDQNQEAAAQKPDDPAHSPYQIWKGSGAYLEGTKVVWHHNVYQAKWWTQGDMPDNPVLQSWQTPWQLIGPVLPGEKPIKQPTLPKGTYPNWSGDDEYEAGDRVLFNDVPYQAKWWTKGDSPAASTSNPDNSPWVPLTQAQIEQIVGTAKTTKATTKK